MKKLLLFLVCAVFYLKRIEAFFITTGYKPWIIPIFDGRSTSIRKNDPPHNHPISSPCWDRTNVILFMGKGDGKKKRQKKSSSPGGGSSSPAEPAPLRVTSNSNIPVKAQLRWAKLNKEYKKQQSNPGFRQKRVARTSYRRAWAEEEIEQKAEERKRKGQDPDWDVILNRNASSPLVIVDGYNIIHKWARLKKQMNKGDPARARQLLIDDLENLASLKGWRIEAVFDGMRRSTTGPLGEGPGDKPSRLDREASKSLTKHGVRIVYSGIGMEADTYIEARCMKAKNETNGALTSSFIVATDDAMIRLAGQNAGAWCMGADRFVDELKAVRAGMSYRVEAAMAKVNGHAVRPEKLRNTVATNRRFGRNSVVIEDKRNRTKVKKQDELLPIYNVTVEVEDEDGTTPWWAQLPTDSNPYRD